MERLTKSKLVNGTPVCYLQNNSGLPEYILITKIFEMISNFNSPWQVLGFGIVVAFIFGCLWLLYKFLTSLF